MHCPRPPAEPVQLDALIAGHCPQVTTLSVNVIVLDVNDNAPQFPFSNFTKSVDEVRME